MRIRTSKRYGPCISIQSNIFHLHHGQTSISPIFFFLDSERHIKYTAHLFESPSLIFFKHKHGYVTWTMKIIHKERTKSTNAVYPVWKRCKPRNNPTGSGCSKERKNKEAEKRRTKPSGSEPAAASAAVIYCEKISRLIKLFSLNYGIHPQPRS